MKQLVSFGKIAACAAVVFAFAAEGFAGWTYDSGAKTLSDDSGWVINPKFGSRGFRYCRIANEPVTFPVAGFV